EDCRHDRVLGRGHARLIEEDIGAHEPVGLEPVALFGLDPRAEPGEGEEVRVHSPPADDIPPRRWEEDPPHPGEEWPRQEDRRADPGREFGGEVRFMYLPGMYTDSIRPDPLGFGADAAEELQEG